MLGKSPGNFYDTIRLVMVPEDGGDDGGVAFIEEFCIGCKGILGLLSLYLILYVLYNP